MKYKQLTSLEKFQVKKIFDKYFKFLCVMGTRMWPSLTEEALDEAIGSFLLELVTSKRDRLQEYASGDRYVKIQRAFIACQPHYFTKKETIITRPFDNYVQVVTSVGRKKSLSLTPASTTSGLVERMKSYVKRYCAAKDYYLFKMLFFRVSSFSRAEVGLLLGMSERDVNRRVYLISRKLTKGGFSYLQ